MQVKGLITESDVNRLDEEIVDILSKALAVYQPDFKTKEGIVQWNRVQMAFHDSIYDFWKRAEDNFNTSLESNPIVFSES